MSTSKEERGVRAPSPVRGRQLRRPHLVAGASLLVVAISTLVYSHLRDDRRTRPRDDTFFPQGEAAFLAGDYDVAVSAFRRSIEAAPRDPRPYRRLIESYARKGDLDAVEPILRALLAADPHNACAHYALGNLARKRFDAETALAEAQRALSLDPRLGHAYLLLGSTHLFAGRPEEALKAWRTARDVFRKEGDRAGEAGALNNMAGLHRDQNEFRRAVREFEEVLNLHRALGDLEGEETALGNLGMTQADLGDLDRARVTLAQAIDLARELHDPIGERLGLMNLCTVYRQVGDYHRALGCSDSAIAIARDMEDRLGEAQGLVTRAVVRLDLGDPTRALKDSRGALAIAESLEDVRHRAGALLTVADACLGVRWLASARAAYAQAESLYRAIGMESESATAILGLSQVAAGEGDTTRALALGEEATAVLARTGYAEGEALAAAFLSTLSLERGDLARALTYSDRAVQLARQVGSRSGEAAALARRARVRFALGDESSAATDARASHRIAVAIRNPEVLWLSETTMGDVSREDDPERALRHYETAMDAVESIRRKLPLEEFKAGYVETRLELYRSAAGLLVDLGRPVDALEVCERSRGAALRDLLSACPTPLAPRVSEPVAARHRMAEERLRSLLGTMYEMADDPDADPRRVRSLEREIGRAREEWEEIRAEILLEDPRYELVVSGGPTPEVERIQAALAPDEALVEYLLGPRVSLCFVARRDTVSAVRLDVDVASLGRDVGELRQPLSSPRSLGTLGFDLALSERVKDRILGPVEPYLRGADRLLIVPDGPLNTVPFEMLVASSGRQGRAEAMYGEFLETQFVGDRYAVVYLPSASLVVPPGRWGSAGSGAGPRRDLLALGNPVSGGAPLWAREEPEGFAAGNPRSEAVGGAPLSHSEQEVRAISRLFSGAVCEVGARATERSFKSLAPDFRLIHVSSHGGLDETVPLYSGVALAPDTSGFEDGFLHAYEVLSVPLACDLVTLSGCETGLGRLYAGEGLLGLTRSFLYAGAKQALVSLWSVNDASTALLMERFYANLAKGMPTPEALQDAKRFLRTLTTPGPGGRPLSYAHPFFWAPFVLVGPAGSVASGGV